MNTLAICLMPFLGEEVPSPMKSISCHDTDPGNQSVL